MKLPGAEGNVAAGHSQSQVPSSKYDAAYKQISAQFNKGLDDEDEVASATNQQQTFQESLQLVKSDESVEIPKNRLKQSRKTMDISMRLAEPINVIDEAQRSQMKVQLKSLKQRAVQHNLRTAQSRQSGLPAIPDQKQSRELVTTIGGEPAKPVEQLTVELNDKEHIN